jgi:hypothetical protein
LNPGLSASRTSTQTRVSNRVEEVYFALIGSKHEIGRVWVRGITLCRGTSGGNSTIYYSQIPFVFGLKRGSHRGPVLLDSGIEPRDGLQICTLAGEKPHRFRL